MPLQLSYHKIYGSFVCPNYQLFTWKLSGHYTLLSPIFNPLHSPAIIDSIYYCTMVRQYILSMVLQMKNASAINPVTTENTDDSHLQIGSHPLRYHKLTPWTVSRNKWDTKENKGKSMKHALYVLQYGKRHIYGWSDVEQWENQARHYRVTLV